MNSVNTTHSLLCGGVCVIVVGQGVALAELVSFIANTTLIKNPVISFQDRLASPKSRINFPSTLLENL